jgi:hypothetical protein
MTVESDLYDTLKVICARTFPDVAPFDTPKPYVTYQQIGGDVIRPLANVVPDKENGEFQVNVWAETRVSAKALIKQIEAALIVATTFQARPVSAPSSDYDHDNLVYGALQSFSIWSTR